MVKVIRKGFEKECPTCGSLLGFTNEDFLEKEVDKQYTEQWPINVFTIELKKVKVKYIICPVCETKINKGDEKDMDIETLLEAQDRAAERLQAWQEEQAAKAKAKAESEKAEQVGESQKPEKP